MNVTTLLVPLLAISALADRIIPKTVAYKDVKYSQALALSAAFQGGVVVWVAFWAFYGHGFSMSTLSEVSMFGGAYMTVVLIEPIADLAVLAAAKGLHQMKDSPLFTSRLYRAGV